MTQGADKDIARIDRRLLLSYGALIALLMLIVDAAACQIFSYLNKREEDRLASALAMVVDQSIGKVSFSGKYHTRLLAEEMKAKVPELAFISVESISGRILAHSDPEMNDKASELPLEAEMRAKCLKGNAPLIEDCVRDGKPVKEVVLPYRGGPDEAALGVVRIGIDTSSVREARHTASLALLALVAVLSAAALWAVLLMSRHFGEKFRALAARLQGIADSVPGVIYQFELESGKGAKTLFASQSAASIFGLKAEPERFIESFAAHLPASRSADFRASIKEAAEKRGAWDFEGSVVSGNEERHFHFIAQPSLAGERTVFSGVLLDVTQRKKAEQELRASQERFADICKLSPIMILISRRNDGTIVDANPSFCAQTGYSLDEISGRSVFDLKLHVDPKVRGLMIEELDRRGVLHDFELELRTKSGLVKTCLVSQAPLSYGGERRLLSLIHDISERKQMEESLRRSRRMIENIMNSIPQAVFWKNREGIYLGCNEVFAKAVGVKSADRIVGKNDFELTWNYQDSLGYRSADQQVMDLKAPLRHIIEEVQIAEGARIWVDTTKIPLVDERGEVYGVLGVFEDISDRKKAEEEKEKLQSQLLQSQKMESIGRLAGGVAHDFNNMLQAIMGYLFLINGELPPESPIAPKLKEIQKAADRSADLTRQLLAFARRQTVAPKTLDLDDSIESMLKMLRRLIGENIRLEWAPKGNLWPVKMDPSQLDQILANLTVNARDAIGESGKVHIETENAVFDESYSKIHPDCAPGPYVMLAVSDTGKGMSKETIEHIFEPFFTTKETGKGTGLGLATVFGIVRQNGGFINVYSELGKGTSFKIYLPRAADEAEEEKPQEEQRSATLKGTETILLVEDEEQILNVGSEMLSSIGYKVLAAASPDAALKLAGAETGPIHLLLTDVVMPGMNGKELQGRVAKLKPGIRCVFMSGYTADVIANHGILEKGVAFLQKPFTMETLARKTREALDS